jgi:hypothetical protein
MAEIFTWKWRATNMAKPREQFDAALAEIFDSFLSNVHTTIPGQVVSFNALLQTCSVQPCLKRKYVDSDSSEDLPIIEDVPVIFPGSDSLFLTYDLKPDSYVLLAFSERAIASFMLSGGIVDPAKRRKFDLSDAVAIPGLIPTPSALLGVDTDAIALRDKINVTKISISTDGTVLLKNKIGSFEIEPLGNCVINNGLETAVAFSRMKIAFDQLKADFNSFVTVKYNTHVHPGVTSGGASTSPTLSTGTASTADMSGAESPTVLLP